MTDSRSVLDAVPGIALVRSYKAGWLRSDVVAGLILTALLVPQGMAYAELAGLPPITGLYTKARSATLRCRWSRRTAIPGRPLPTRRSWP